ncbi:cytochrome P450 CYP72A616-like [Aristolochia californica]|uniref:cytochrome P450 CYP72A616-like n=1 Tax=Aristolochia californica TaxID=171875 RepID=UPI0035D7BB87
MAGVLFFLIVSSPMLLLWVLIVVIHSFWLKPMKLERYLKRQGVTGDPYSFFSGDLKRMGNAVKEACSKPMMELNHAIVPRVIPFVHQTVQKHGKISVTWNGATPRVIIMDSKLMRSILQHKLDQIQKPPLNPHINLLTRGISSLEGDHWFHRRRLMNPAFLMEKLKLMIPAFSTSSTELIKKWERLASTHGSCELDVWPDLQIFSSDVISRAAFGSSYEKGQRIFLLQKEQIRLVLEAASSVYLPGFRFVPTKKNMRRNYLDKEIKSMLRNLINEKEAAMKTGGSMDDDTLLGLLLKNCCNEENEEKKGLTVEDVIEECKLFYFAGQETTAILLTWTMILLSMHPKWQEDARKEVMETCGKEQPDFESINRLKIVSMIFNEVLRLYPPVPGLHRYTRRDIKLGDISFPAGVEIFLPTVMIHHDPECWGEDAEQFNPDRFSEGITKASKNDQNVFFPFGWGPRMCIGLNFSMIEAKMALAMILQRFSFQMSPTYAHAPYTVITLQPQHGAQLILHKL